MFRFVIPIFFRIFVGKSIDNRMATTENINAMISSYERIEGEYSFKKFLQSANIKSGTYACISKLLERVKKAITVSLTNEEIEKLKSIWETYLKIQGAFPIEDETAPKTMKVSELEMIFGELWRKKPLKGDSGDNKESTPFWKSDKDVAQFWNDNNRRQVETYHDICDYLNRDIRLSFNSKISSINDDDIRESIFGFFKLINEIRDSTVRKQLVDFICSFRSIISVNGQIQTDSVERLINDEVVPRQIARFFVLKVKNNYFEGKHAIEKKKDRDGNSGYFIHDEIRQMSQQDNAKYADIINKIIDALLKENVKTGEKPVHYWTNLTRFLNILRLLRNGMAHYLQDMVEEGEQLAVACFILHTYVGTYLSIKKNLQNQGVLSEPFDYEELDVKTLTVYFNSELKKEVSDIEYIKDIIKPKLYRLKEEMPINEADGYSEYRIERGEHYILRCGAGKNAVEEKVPYEMFWNTASTNPVAFWDGVTYHFYPDLSTMSSELNPLVQTAQKKDLEKIVHLLKQVESHLEGIKKGTDELKAIRETLALGQKRLEDLGDKIDRGFDTAHQDAEEQKGLLKRIIEALERKEQKDSGIVNKTAIIVIIIAIIAGISYKVWPKDKPEVLITKGDHYLRNGDAEKAGETYRKAIKAYEDILSEDSVDVDANLGLAMMLMRGKGIYDLAEAEHCAKRASEESTKAEGLYHYLLFLNKKYGDADHLVGNLRADGEKDEYTILTDALLEIYGCCDRERSLESVLRARTVLDSLCKFNQDAVLDRAGIVKYGIERENCEDDFYIWPDPIFAESDLSVIANDSLNPVAMAMLSEFYGQLGEMKDCLEWGVSAYECGMKAYAPSLTIQMLQNNIIENPGIDFKAIFKELERSARHDKSLTGECAKYMTRVHNYSINEMPAKDLLKSTDDFIDILKLTQDGNYAQFLEQLYRFRVTLCLEVGDLPRATSLAMKVDVFNDSIAVSQYLEGICCDRGWAGQPQDSILRDNLINSSAERGYPEAVYTRLKKAEPLRCYPIRINRKDPVYKFTTAERVFASDIYRKFGNKGVFRNSFYRNGKQSAKPIFDLTFITPVTNSIKPESLPKEEIVEASSQTSPFVMGEAEVELKDDFDYKDFQYVVGIHYDASIYAQISDSIWSKSPKLAVELADYWRDYYSPGPYYLPIQEQDSPYVEYCPKEYQVIWDVLARCYNYVELSNGNDGLVTVDLINKPIMEDYFAEIKIGIASALKHGNSEMAKHLITMWLTLSNNNEVDEAEKVRYEKFALPEYKNKGFQPYKKIDYPIYAY